MVARAEQIIIIFLFFLWLAQLARSGVWNHKIPSGTVEEGWTWDLADVSLPVIYHMFMAAMFHRVSYKNRTKTVCHWPHSVMVWFLCSVDYILRRHRVILWLSRHTCLLARSRICWPKSVGAPGSCFVLPPRSSHLVLILPGQALLS